MGYWDGVGGRALRSIILRYACRVWVIYVGFGMSALGLLSPR